MYEDGLQAHLYGIYGTMSTLAGHGDGTAPSLPRRHAPCSIHPVTRGESEAAMQILLILTGVISAAMLVYLTYVLLKGENL